MNCRINSKKICGKDDCIVCFQKSFANHIRSKNWSINNVINPIQIYIKSPIKYKFICDVCDHEFEISPRNISNGNWCAYCSHSRLCYNNNCNYCYNQSFASHPMSSIWASCNIIIPRMVFKRANSKYWFNCKLCNHLYEIKLNSIKSDHQCSYCSSLLLCDSDECLVCFNHSFASHPMAQSWSNDNTIQPRFIMKHSAYNGRFNCKKCNHTFNVKLCNIQSDQQCAFCSNKKICDDNNCMLCYKKSFASHPMSEQWSSKNILNPRRIITSNSEKFIFDCNKCGFEYKMKIAHIKRGQSCPKCFNKTELLMFSYLKNLNERWKTQVTLDFCRSIKRHCIKLPFDFGLDNILIELDGNQHFKQIMNWKSPENTMLSDIYKINSAISNGYSIIRIPQDDIYYNKYNWKIIIEEEIKILQKNKPMCVFIESKENIYDMHIEHLDNNIPYCIRKI